MTTEAITLPRIIQSGWVDRQTGEPTESRRSPFAVHLITPESEGVTWVQLGSHPMSAIALDNEDYRRRDAWLRGDFLRDEAQSLAETYLRPLREQQGETSFPRVIVGYRPFGHDNFAIGTNEHSLFVQLGFMASNEHRHPAGIWLDSDTLQRQDSRAYPDSRKIGDPDLLRAQEFARQWKAAQDSATPSTDAAAPVEVGAVDREYVDKYGITKTLLDKVQQLATDAGHCEEFDELCEQAGLPGRERSYGIPVQYSAQTTVRTTAASQEDAERLARARLLAETPSHVDLSELSLPSDRLVPRRRIFIRLVDDEGKYTDEVR